MVERLGRVLSKSPWTSSFTYVPEKRVIVECEDNTHISRGGTDSPKWHFFMFSSKFLCYGQLWAISSKTLYSFRENLPSNRPNYFLDFPIIGPKNKVVVNFIYGYQTLSGEKCKSNGKRISSIRHTSEEKNPKNHPKIPYFRKVVFSDGFLDFSLHWYVGLS